MSYVGYSGVCNLALTYPAWAEGATAIASSGSDLGEGVAGSEVVWMASGIPAPGYILLEISGDSDPLDYVLEENDFRIRLEAF